MNILVLGTGLQGKAALYDLARSPAVSHVVAADTNIADLSAFVEGLPTDKVRCVQVDARDEEQVASLMKPAQAVILLLPESFRLACVELAVRCGVHLVDASYALPAYQQFERAAQEKGVAILPEFGLDPGIDLLLVAQAVQALDEVHEIHSYGAGIPELSAADNPLKYKISWTFSGVLASYRRPARLVREGAPLEIPADEMFVPANVHAVELQGLGTLEAFPNGDVTPYLDPLGISGSVREAGRYTMRWPGHAALIRALADLGFLQEEPVQVNGARVSPIQFVHDLLGPQLQYEQDERDLAIVRVEVRGAKDGRRKHLVSQVIDRRDLETGLLAMQRTVGFTASIGAQMILRGDIHKRGLLSPATDVPAEVFFDELRQRGIVVERTEMAESQT